MSVYDKVHQQLTPKKLTATLNWVFGQTKGYGSPQFATIALTIFAFGDVLGQQSP